MATQFITPYIATGVRNDLENLLSCFTETQSVRYEEFAKVWREMKIPLIFYGRQDVRELRQFIEEVFSIAVNYALPPFSFQVRTGGLYILYGLFNKQPCLPKIKVRVTQTQWVQLMELVAEAKKQGHLDAVYVFLKLRYQQAFHFCAIPKQLFPKSSSTKESDARRDLEEEEMASHNLLSELFESNNVDRLADVHDQYHRLKCALSAPNATKPDGDIDMIHSNLVQFITKTVAGFDEFKKTGKKPRRKRRDSGATTSESEGDSDSEVGFSRPSRGQGAIRSEIRQRAFSAKPESSRGRRHRKVKVAEGQKDKSSPRRKRKRNTDPEEFASQEQRNIEEQPSTETTAEDTADEEPSGGDSTQTNEQILNMPTSFEDQLAAADKIVQETKNPKRRKSTTSQAAKSKVVKKESEPGGAGGDRGAENANAKSKKQKKRSTSPQASTQDDSNMSKSPARRKSGDKKGKTIPSPDSSRAASQKIVNTHVGYKSPGKKKQGKKSPETHQETTASSEETPVPVTVVTPPRRKGTGQDESKTQVKQEKSSPSDSDHQLRSRSTKSDNQQASQKDAEKKMVSTRRRSASVDTGEKEPVQTPPTSPRSRSSAASPHKRKQESPRKRMRRL